MVTSDSGLVPPIAAVSGAFNGRAVGFIVENSWRGGGGASSAGPATPHGSPESRPTISEIVVTKLEIVLMAFFRERAAEMRTRMGKILRRAKEQPAESQPGSRKHRAEFSEAPAAD